jgi:hypothetical protein
MQPEEGYLWEVSQLMHALIESTDLETTLAMRHHLHSEVYSRMHTYGFQSKEEVRNAVQYMRSGQSDPDKDARALRAKEWKERQDGSNKETVSAATDKPQSAFRLFSSLKEKLSIKVNFKEDKNLDLDRDH